MKRASRSSAPGQLGVPVAALVLLLAAAPAVAAPADSLEQKHRLIWITEFGGGIKLDHSPLEPSNNDPNWFVLIQLGLLRRTSDKVAMGGVLFLGGNDRRSRIGLKFRYRRYLSAATSIEASPGIIIGGWYSQEGMFVSPYNSYAGPYYYPRKPSFPTPAASVAFNYKDILVPTIELELDRSQTGATDLRWYGVLEIGSKPGIILGVAGLIAASAAVGLAASVASSGF